MDLSTEAIRWMPMGTRRHWKTGEFQKTPAGWRRVPKEKHKASGETPREDPKRTESTLAGHIVPIPTGKKWTDVTKRDQSSYDQHFKEGRPTDDRQRLYKKIFSSFLDHVPHVPPGKKPFAIMTMGAPASGKSELVQQLPKNFIHVDPDALKEMLPEYNELVKKGDKNAAMYVHDESTYMANRLRDAVYRTKKNAVFEGTGKSASYYLNQIRKLQDHGFSVHIMMPDVEADTAVERSQDRHARKGRYIPEPVVRDIASVVPHNFLPIARAADSAQLFNSNVLPPKLVWSRDKNGEKVHDADYWDEFRRKYDKKESLRAMNSASSVIAELRTLLSEKELEPDFDVDAFAKKVEGMKLQDPLKGKPRFKEGEGVIIPEPAW